MGIASHLPALVPASELRLADVVEVFAGPYGTATVRQIKDDQVYFFRPYTRSDDFAYTGGVICYTGIEEFSVSVDTPTPFKLYHRKELK